MINEVKNENSDVGGAFVNAGDFLIEQRSKAILEKVLEGCEVNALNMKNLIIFMRKRFPLAEIKVFFHRGIVKYHAECIFEKFQREYQISVKDISGSAHSF